MLLQLRDYISREGVVSTQQMAREFAIDSSALQPMLDFWMAKGMIQKCSEMPSCQSSCFKCQSKPHDYYQSVFTKNPQS